MENYHVVSNLGAGTYGSVWKAAHRTTGVVVAIEKLEREYHSLQECINLREVQSLIKMSSHPNIVDLQHFIFEMHQFFFVFGHMNRDLHQLIRNRDKAFPEAEVRRWMLQVLQAVEYVHEEGYIHKDVIKVADLGLARDVRSGGPCTSGVSSTWYMAPEVLLQAPLQSSRYGAAVDVWAAGAIVAELFTLGPLFRGTSEMDQMYRIMLVLGAPTEQTWPEGVRMAASMGFQFPRLGSPWPLAEYIPNAGPEAVDLISALCRWDPSKRPTASQASQHPFFQNRKQHRVPLPLPRQGCESNLQSAKHGVSSKGGEGLWRIERCCSSTRGSGGMITLRPSEQGEGGREAIDHVRTVTC